MLKRRYCIPIIFLFCLFVVILVGSFLSSYYDGIETLFRLHDTSVIFYSTDQNSPVLELPVTLVFMFVAGLIFLIFIILCLSFNRRKLSSIHEEAISQRQFLENIINRMPIGIAIVDVFADDLCIFLNERYTLYSGLNSEEIYGKHLSQDKEFQMVKCEVLQKKSSISVEGIDLWQGALAGRYLRCTTTPVYNEKGKCVFIIRDIIDLTNVHVNKVEARESWSRLGKFVEQNVASIGFFLPMYENGMFTGVTIEDVNAEYTNMFSKLHIDAVGGHITPETPGCEWLMEAFLALHIETEKPYTFNNIYIDALVRYIFGYAFWCSENPAYICVYIVDKSEEMFLRSAELKALENLAKNILALATLNDKIRNPLSIIMSYMEIHPLPCAAQLLSFVKSMNSFIDTLDQGFSESESLYLAIERQNNEEKAPKVDELRKQR